MATYRGQMNRSMPRLLIAMAVALALATSGSPASATTKDFTDPTGDTDNAGLLDIGKVRVVNTPTYVSIRFRFPPNDFFPGPEGRFEVLLDTDARQSGPELAWSAPLFSEFSVAPVRKGKHLRSKEWLTNTPKASRCGRTVRIDWNPPKGYGRLKIFKKAGCLGTPAKIRVNVKTVVTGEHTKRDGMRRYTHSETDYYPKRGAYSPWVRR
jgi:hypothetical protein